MPWAVGDATEQAYRRRDGVSIRRFAANGMRSGMTGPSQFHSIRFCGEQSGGGRSQGVVRTNDK